MNEFLPTLVPTTIWDYPMIQNMARFMTYEMSRYCGTGSQKWQMPKDGLYECYNFKKFFNNSDHKIYIVKIGDELAGFAIISKGMHSVDWFIEEFFIIARYQGKGVAQSVINWIWETYKGNWELSVIPENIPALKFWRRAVSDICQGNFKDEIRVVDYDDYQPTRHFLSFKI